MSESRSIAVGISYLTHVANLLDASAFGAGCGSYGAILVELFGVFFDSFINSKDVFLCIFGQISVLAAFCEINVDINLFIYRIGDSIGVIDLIESMFFSAVCADFIAVVLAGSAYNNFKVVTGCDRTFDRYIFGGSSANGAQLISHSAFGAGSFLNHIGVLMSGCFENVDFSSRASFAGGENLTVSRASSFGSASGFPIVTGCFGCFGGKLVSAKFASFHSVSACGAGSGYYYFLSFVIFVIELVQNGGSAILAATRAHHGLESCSGAGSGNFGCDFGEIVSEFFIGFGYVFVTANFAGIVLASFVFAGSGNDGSFFAIFVSEFVGFGDLLLSADITFLNGYALGSASSFGFGNEAVCVGSDIAGEIGFFYISADLAGLFSVSSFLASSADVGHFAEGMYVGYGKKGSLFLIANGAAFKNGTCGFASSVDSAYFYVIMITGSGCALNILNIAASSAGSEGITVGSASSGYRFVNVCVTGSEQSFFAYYSAAILANDFLASVGDAGCCNNNFGGVKMSGCFGNVGFFFKTASFTGLDGITVGRASSRNYFCGTIVVTFCRRRFHISIAAVFAGMGDKAARDASCGVFAEFELRMSTFFVTSCERYASHAHDNQRQQGNQ